MKQMTLDGKTYAVEPLFADNFTNLDNWVFETTGKASVQNNVLRWDCSLPKGMGTAWCTRRFRGPTIITYDVAILGGKYNINFLFYARKESGGRDVLLETTGERTGDYGEYHVFPNYIITYLSNTKGAKETSEWRVRFRRDPGFKLLSETFIPKTIRPGTWQRIAYAFEKDGTITLYVDGKRLHTYKDEDPLPLEGLHGLRTWQTDLQYRNFKVYQIVEGTGGGAGTNGSAAAPTVLEEDFESGRLDDWQTSGGRIEVVGSGGGRVCRIVAASDQNNTWLVRTIPVGALHGKRLFVAGRYRLNELVRGKARYSGVGITVVQAEAGSQRKRWSGGPVFLAQDKDRWTRFRFPVDLFGRLKDATLRIGFQKAKGTLFLDDLHITAGSQTLPNRIDEVVADNAGNAFTKTRSWNVSTKVPGFWGKDYLWHRCGDGSGKATWTLVAPTGGRWQVGARWTWGLHGTKDRATNAPFTVVHPGGKQEIRVNMADKALAGRFNPLAVLDLKQGDRVRVSVSNDADQSVVADAVRLVRLPDGCAGSEFLYENTFAKPRRAQEAEASREWVMEGGGVVAFPGEGLRLRARNFTVNRSRTETDHFVYWLKRDFPADLAVEWDFRFPEAKLGPKGLAILFICAKGVQGEDIFDPKLARRDGIFARYTRGDINSYHISYVAIGRGRANVRKNSGFYKVTSGPDLVTKGGADKWHRLRLTRFGGLLELTVNGERCLSWIDDGQTYGPVHGGGKLGLRHQNNLYYGDYRNLRVYRLKK